jgi:large subunit ribosomal protein L10
MAITRQRKEKVIASLVEDLDKAGSIVLTDFTGINVQDMTDLRNHMRESSVTFTIVKNTLLKRVFDQLEVDGDQGVYALMEGPTALAYAEDEVTPMKVIKKFAENHKGLPVVKGGFVSGETYAAGQMLQLADIPSREELLAKMLGSLNSPVQAFMSVSNGIVRSFFYAVNALMESKKNK